MLLVGTPHGASGHQPGAEGKVAPGLARWGTAPTFRRALPCSRPRPWATCWGRSRLSTSTDTDPVLSWTEGSLPVLLLRSLFLSALDLITAFALRSVSFLLASF